MSSTRATSVKDPLSEQSSEAVSKSHTLENAAERFIRARSRNVLLVEDNAAHAALIRRALDQATWEIEHVTRASAALASFSTDTNRIVLLDLSLPDGEGLDILKRLLSIDSAGSVIIVTSLEQVSTSVEAMRCGAVDYVVKGDPAETAHRLKQALERAYARRLQQAQDTLVAEAKVVELVRAERLEAIELIVRTVCHEVNNPLSGVVALSQLLGDATKELDADVKRLADGILNSAQEVARVVKKLHTTQDLPKEFGGKKIVDIHADPAPHRELRK